MPLFNFIKYQQVLLFLGIGLLLWVAIGLQLFEHDVPCFRCWEVRGLYLIILQVVMLNLIFGYKESLSIVLIVLFMVAGNYITVEQLIQHTINITKGNAFRLGYGAYATFLDIPLPYWNLLIDNLAIIYLSIMNCLSHRFNITQYVCQSKLSRAGALIWSISPLLVNVYLFASIK